MKVCLSHNPFLIDTSITIDGVVLNADHHLVEKLNGRLQMWADHLFSCLYDELGRPDQIQLLFTGLKSDFDDLHNAAAQAETQLGIQITLEHSEVDSAETRLERLDQLIQQAQEGELKTILGTQLDELIDAYHAATTPEYEVNIVATLSSGKSTVINSILGTELLPSKNEACTAALVRLYADNDTPHFLGESFDVNGNRIHPLQNVHNDELVDWNETANGDNEDRLSSINLYGPIPAIQQNTHSRLVLVDTPGPNNSQNAEHSKTTYQAITSRQMPMVVYVLNVTQLGTNDDRGLLESIKEHMDAGGGKQAQDRFIFLINKIDEYDVDRDGPISGLIERVKNYLGIDRPTIIPVSALFTLLSRKKSRGESFTRREKSGFAGLIEMFNEDDFNVLKHVDVSPSVKDAVSDMLEKAKLENDAETIASINAGIPVLECVIDEYLHKYALPFKIHRTYTEIQDHLSSIRNHQQSIQDILIADEKQIEEIQTKIKSIQEKISHGDLAKSFRKEVLSKPIELDQDTSPAIASIQNKTERKLTQIGNKFNSEGISRKEAHTLIEEATQEYADFRSEVLAHLENVREKSLETDLVRFLDDYKKYISELFGLEDGDISVPALESLRMTAMTMPSIEKLIEEASYRKKDIVAKRTVSTSVWYKPWTWGDEKTVNVYRENEYVKLRDVWRDLQKTMAEDVSGMISDVQDDIKNHGKQMRSAFFNEADKILEKNISKLLEESAELLQHHEAKDALINKNKYEFTLVSSFSGSVHQALQF